MGTATRRRRLLAAAAVAALTFTGMQVASTHTPAHAMPLCNSGNPIIVPVNTTQSYSNCNIDASGGMAFVQNSGTLTLFEITISGTSVSGDGGAVYNTGTLNMTRVTIQNGVASGNGGNIYNSGTITGSADQMGGGRATNGANIYNTGQMVLTAPSINKSFASGDGGDVYNTGYFEVDGGNVSGGYAGLNTQSGSNGGAFWNNGTLIVNNVFVEANFADAGGALWNDSGGTATFTGSGICDSGTRNGTDGPTFANMTGASLTINGSVVGADGVNTLCVMGGQPNLNPSGAVIESGGTLNISLTTIGDNKSTDGILTAGTTTIGQSAVFENAKTGAEIVEVAGTLSLTDSTISGADIATGPGIHVAAGSASVARDTVADNLGGLDIDSGASATVHDTIIAQNSEGGLTPNCTIQGGGTLTDTGNNLQDDSSCVSGGSDITTTAGSAGLGALQWNGGMTYSEALQPGSPAGGAGNCTGGHQDQLGNTRPSPNCSIGAVELGSVGATVSGETEDSTFNAMPDTEILVCDQNNNCIDTTSDDNGNYSVGGLPAGTYTFTAYSTSADYFNGSFTITVANTTNYSNQNFVLQALTVPPSSAGLSGGGIESFDSAGVPVIDPGTAWTLTAACPTGNTVSYTITAVGQTGSITGGMTETPSGSGNYVATVPDADSSTTWVQPYAVTVTVNCGGGPNIVFNCEYIDPSGTVLDQNNDPVSGATVTLYRSDSQGGPFVQVPNGSSIMDPSNRQNPYTTDGTGRFEWNVIAGYYQIRVTHPGCKDPSSSNVYAATGTLTIPPPAIGLNIHLDCITAPDQFIDFGSLPDLQTASPSFSVSAEASSGLPVTFTAAGKCASSGPQGSTITVSHMPGLCTVTAHQGGNGAYNAAPAVAEAFNVVSPPGTSAIRYTGSTAVTHGSDLAVSAILTYKSHAIQNQVLTFTLGNERCTGITASDGSVSCSIKDVQSATSHKTLVMAFQATTLYKGKSVKKSITINPSNL
jgi:hypothetical protein